MNPGEKAKQIIDKFLPLVEAFTEIGRLENAKKCASIAVENEYHSLREMLFNLRSCHVIESEKVYLFRLQKLINEEKEVKQEIENYEPNI